MDKKPPQNTESRHADKYIVRFPDGMRDQLQAAARGHNRTLNAEIVSRLQDSFGMGDLQAMDADLAKVRTEAWHHAVVADVADSYRSFTVALLLAALQALPPEQWPAGIRPQTLDVLTQGDERGPLFAILALIDGTDPVMVEKLRNFGSHLEDEGLDNRTMLRQLKEAAVHKAVELPEGKKNLVDNLGRADVTSTREKIGRTQEKLLEAIQRTEPPPVQLSKGPRPSTNARARAPKKG